MSSEKIMKNFSLNPNKLEKYVKELRQNFMKFYKNFEEFWENFKEILRKF